VSATAEDLIRRVHEAGAALEPTPERGLRLRTPRPLPGELVATLRARKAELLSLLAPKSRIADLAAEMGLHLADVREAAGPDFDELARDPNTARGFLPAMRDRRDREAGRVPAGWTTVGLCERCGPVWLFPGAPERVAGCPWCFSRLQGRPIPRPPMTCGSCRHFTPDPMGAGGAGRCAVAMADGPDRPGDPPRYPHARRRCPGWRPTT